MTLLEWIKEEIKTAVIFIENNRQKKPDPTLGEIRTLQQYILNIDRALKKSERNR